MWIVVGILFDVLDIWLLVISVILKLWFWSILRGGVKWWSFGILIVEGFWKWIIIM